MAVWKNIGVGLLAVAVAYGFWLGRPQWDPEMRLWRAVGDSSLMLLFAVLALGPLVRLYPGAVKLLSYRRELGVWFGWLAIVHTLLVLKGWARWDALRFLGYEYVPQLGRLVRLEPGFGLANLLGFVAVLITLVLMATSTNWAMRRLGGGAWKVLQMSAHTVFYLTVLHTAYFLFMHYTASFHRTVPESPNGFRFWFLALSGLVVLLQAAAYLKVTKRPGVSSASGKS